MVSVGVGDEQVEQRHVGDHLVPSSSQHDDGVDLVAVVAVLGQPRLARPRPGRPGRRGRARVVMNPPAFVLGVVQQPGQLLAGARRASARAARRVLGGAEVAQRVDGLVGFHRRDQVRGLLGLGLAQQTLQLVGVHLLQRVGGGLGLQRGQQLLAAGAAEVLEQVGELARAQPVQGLLAARAAAPWPGPSVASSPKGATASQSMTRSGVGRPRHRRGPRRRSRVCTLTSTPTSTNLVADRGQVEVGGADDLDPVDVDELVVEHVPGQQHLPGAADVVTQVQPGGAQPTSTRG